MGAAVTEDPPRGLRLVHPVPAPVQREIIPSPILGTLIFVGSEIMLFAGLISAFIIVKAAAPGGIWPPPGQPRLPVLATGMNTLVLLASGVLLFLAWRRFQQDPVAARSTFLASVALGSAFVTFQGVEWYALLSQGMTMQSSTLGSFFTLIVGLHAIHAVVALGVMLNLYRLLSQGRLHRDTFGAMQVFWYFVVGIWPVLYWQVYL